MRARAIALLSILALCAGCGRRDTRSGADSTGAVVPRDSLIHAIAPELEEWVGMWRAAMPGFSLDSVRSDGLQKWQPVMVVTSESSFILRRERDRDDPTLQILGLPSPDGRRLLDIDSYQLIEIQGERMEVGGEPDSRSAVLDRSAGTEAVLFFSGTAAGAHWGRWLSHDRFVLGGWQDANDEAEERQGWLSVFDLRDSTVASYSTRGVSRPDYDRYYDAWKRWLMKRYQETRPTPRIG